MKIRGHTVGTTMPRSNWEQTDPKKADYIKGKEAVDQAIKNAQSTADDAKTAAGKAQTAADNAATAAGKAQTTADNAATAASKAQTTADNAVTAAGNAQTAADNAQTTADSKTSFFTAVVTLEVSGWEDNRQMVTVAGVMADVNQPIIVTPTTASEESFNACVVKPAEQGENEITFTCETVPDTDIAVRVVGFTGVANTNNGSATPSNSVALTDQTSGATVALYVSDGKLYIA